MLQEGAALFIKKHFDDWKFCIVLFVYLFVLRHICTVLYRYAPERGVNELKEK